MYKRMHSAHQFSTESTRGRDSDFGGIGGGCQVTGKLTIQLLADDNPDGTILAATIDKQ